MGILVDFSSLISGICFSILYVILIYISYIFTSIIFLVLSKSLEVLSKEMLKVIFLIIDVLVIYFLDSIYFTPLKNHQFNHFENLFLTFFVLVVIEYFFISVSSRYKKIRKYDIIIILGMRIKKTNEISNQLRARLDKAISIYCTNLEKPTIVVSGGAVHTAINEAETMYDYLVSNGIPKNKIIVENEATNTINNFKMSYEIMANIYGNNVNKLLYCYVTSDYHIIRSSIFAHKYFKKIDGIGCKTESRVYLKLCKNELVTLIFRNKRTIVILLIISLLLYL